MNPVRSEIQTSLERIIADHQREEDFPLRCDVRRAIDMLDSLWDEVVRTRQALRELSPDHPILDLDTGRWLALRFPPDPLTRR